VTERRISHGSADYLEATINPPCAPNERRALEAGEFRSFHQSRLLLVVELIFIQLDRNMVRVLSFFYVVHEDLDLFHNECERITLVL